MHKVRVNGNKVNCLIAKQLMTNNELCQRAQLSTSTVRAAIVGSPVSLITVGKLAKALGVEPEEIMLL